MQLMKAAALAAAVLSLAACQRAEPEAAASAWDPDKSQLTEQRLETLTEIARELRDANNGYPVPEAQLMDEIRKRNPDALVDGYGRPFRYVSIDENTGHSLKTGFEFVSQGADVNNVADDLKRGAVVEQTASD